MKIKVVCLTYNGINFYALERRRLFRRSLWCTENWSRGGDLIKFATKEEAEDNPFVLSDWVWQKFNLKSFGYRRC